MNRPGSRTSVIRVFAPTQATGWAHQYRDVGWTRPTVFGVVDGLVTNAALIVGGRVSAHAIVLTGLAYQGGHCRRPTDVSRKVRRTDGSGLQYRRGDMDPDRSSVLSTARFTPRPRVARFYGVSRGGA
jgi:hypothetical protein